MKIIYSNFAIETLKEIVDFLYLKWTEKEVLILKNDINDFQEKVLEND